MRRRREPVPKRVKAGQNRIARRKPREPDRFRPNSTVSTIAGNPRAIPEVAASRERNKGKKIEKGEINMANRKNANGKSRRSNGMAKKSRRATRSSGHTRRAPGTQAGNGMTNHRSENA